MRPVCVARLTTVSATHELMRDGGGYMIATTVEGRLVCERLLTVDEAMEWCETTKRCGGVVYGREVVR